MWGRRRGRPPPGAAVTAALRGGGATAAASEREGGGSALQAASSSASTSFIDQLALDVHNGFHGRFRQLVGGDSGGRAGGNATTHAWSLSAPQALIGSLGGVQMLLPLFSSIFNAAPPLDVDNNSDEVEDNLDEAVDEAADEEDNHGRGSLVAHAALTGGGRGGRNIAARLNVLSCFIAGQGASQQECVRIGAIGMVEFALFHASPESLAKEHPQRLVAAVESLCAAAARGGGEAAASLLKRLSSEEEADAAGDGGGATACASATAPSAHEPMIHVPFVPAWRSTPLGDQATARLLFNLRLWGYGGTRALQAALLLRLRLYARAQPLRVRQLVGVRRLLDAMAELYPDYHFLDEDDDSAAALQVGNARANEDNLTDDESDGNGEQVSSPASSPAPPVPIPPESAAARRAKRRRRSFRPVDTRNNHAASVFSMLDNDSGLPKVDDVRCPVRTLASQRLNRKERQGMRLAVLSVIWEAMTSFGEAEESSGGLSSTGTTPPSSPGYVASPQASPQGTAHAQIASTSLEPEIRAILQFLCNPDPAGALTPSSGGRVDRNDVAMVRDVNYLLVGLLRRASPPPGLYPALHSIALSSHALSPATGSAFGIGGDAAVNGPSVLSALLVNRVVDSSGDDQRSMGLQLLATFLARLSAHSNDLVDHMQIRGSRSGSSADLDHHEVDRASTTAARFHAAGGTALLCEVLERHSSWLAGGTYAALIEMLLVGDEDNVGWNYCDVEESQAALDTNNDDMTAGSLNGDEASGSDEAMASAKNGVTFARPSASPAGLELASLMGQGKILTAKQQARSEGADEPGVGAAACNL